MFIGSVRTEKESAVAEGADLTSDLLPLGEKVRTPYFQQRKGKIGSYREKVEKRKLKEKRGKK